MEVSKMQIHYGEKNVRPVFTIGLLLLVLNLNVACHQIRGLQDRHLRQLPGVSELVGTWNIDLESLQRLRDSHENLNRTKVDDHVLILRQDGTCFFQTYWAFQSDQNYAISEGKWKPALVETVAGTGEQGAAVVVTFKTTEGGEVTTNFWIVREKGRLVLWKYIGDPDYTRYADFHQLKR